MIMKKDIGKAFMDNMSRDPGYWKGPFYYNRKDPRLMVPKLNSSLGLTFNFASPYAYITIGAIIAIVLAGAFIIW